MLETSMLQAARETLARYWQDYRDRAEGQRELSYLSATDIELLARDCGLSPRQFKDVMKRGPHAADELLELMNALGIDETALKSTDRGSFNDMKLICSECGRKSTCRRSLRRGTAANDFGEYCNNSEILGDARRVAYLATG